MGVKLCNPRCKCNLNVIKIKHLSKRNKKKRLLSEPLYMFSQRNNPYCELLQFVMQK